MRTCLLFSVRVLVVLSTFGVGLRAQDFKKDVIYEIVTDRFVDGDPTNDDPSQSLGLYDKTKTNWHAYWGGDLAGIQSKMEYLKGMGITAIWISPPVDNENVNTYGTASVPQAGYHGYWARDFQRIRRTLRQRKQFVGGVRQYGGGSACGWDQGDCRFCGKPFKSAGQGRVRVAVQQGDADGGI